VFCRQCGYNNDKYASVCRRCGSVLRDIGNYAPDTPQEASTDEEIIDEMITRQSGGLKLAKKKDPILLTIKKRFKKLEYASDDTKKWLIAGCVAGAIVICLAVFGLARLIESCSTTHAYVYASESSSIAADTCALTDEHGEWIYFSKLYGDNPGLFKVSAYDDGGEELKLSYHRLTQMLYTEEWIYGTDADDGRLWRVPTIGGTAQLVTEDTVEDVNIVNDDLYYIGSDGCIWSASLRRVDEETTVTPERLSEKQAMCLTVRADKMYFIEPDDPALTTTTTAAPVSDSSLPFFGADESDKIVSPFEDTVYGKIISMDTDGGNAKVIGSEKAAYLTVEGDNLYYAVGTTVLVSTGDVDLITGEPETVDYAALQMRRRSVKGGDAVNFNEPGVAGGFLNFTSSDVYFVSAKSGLLRCSLKGDETTYVFTGESDIDSVSIVGKWLYYWADDYSRYCRVPLEGGTVEVICAKNQWQ